MIELLRKREFDLALPLLSAMKETWPSDAMFTAAAVTDDTSDDSSMSTDDDSSGHVANLLGCLQHVFLGEHLSLVFDVAAGGVTEFKFECCRKPTIFEHLNPSDVRRQFLVECEFCFVLINSTLF